MSAFKKGHEFLDYSTEIQMFLTTHSPAFYSLSKNEDRVATYFASNSIDTGSCFERVSAGGMENVDRGVLQLVSPYVEEKNNEIEQLKQDISEYKRCNKIEDRPTIFVEGLSDVTLFQAGLELFYPGSGISVVSQKAGGSNYVKHSLLAWAVSPVLRSKAFGFFDCDDAGSRAKKEYDDQLSYIRKNSTKTKSIKLAFPSDSRSLLGKGIKFPVALEELLPDAFWNYALQREWVEERTDLHKYNNVDKFFTRGFEKVCQEKGVLRDKFPRVFYKIKDQHKDDFVNYVLGLDKETKMKALASLNENLKLAVDFLS